MIGFNSNEEMIKLFRTSSWGVSESSKGIYIRKQKCGMQAKRILELGRIKYIQSQGMEVTLKKYCESIESPENLLIIVKRPS
jgi:hypothetical protein